MSADLALRRIEAIVADIERLAAEIGSPWRQREDGEALEITEKILAKREGKNAA